MALIKCKECGKDISDKASSCPHCGSPVQVVRQDVPAKAVTIEMTGKKWKVMTLVSVVGLVLGIILSFSGKGTSGAGGLITILSLILLVVAKVGSWWNHA